MLERSELASSCLALLSVLWTSQVDAQPSLRTKALQAIMPTCMEQAANLPDTRGWPRASRADLCSCLVMRAVDNALAVDPNVMRAADPIPTVRRAIKPIAPMCFLEHDPTIETRSPIPPAEVSSFIDLATGQYHLIVPVPPPGASRDREASRRPPLPPRSGEQSKRSIYDLFLED